MKCKVCNAELQKNTLFCSECGGKVEQETEQERTESTEILICQNCGAELLPDVKFCGYCGASVHSDEAASDENPALHVSEESETSIAKITNKVEKNPKVYAIVAAAVIVVIMVVCVICGFNAGEKNAAKSAASTTTAKSYSSASQSTSSTSYMATVARALYNEVQRKYSAADPSSTKYKVNKTEKQSVYTTIYGKLYLYDKYGKATTGYVDGSGSYIRTFEVKIKNSTGSVVSCNIR